MMGYTKKDYDIEWGNMFGSGWATCIWCGEEGRASRERWVDGASKVSVKVVHTASCRLIRAAESKQ